MTRDRPRALLALGSDRLAGLLLPDPLRHELAGYVDLHPDLVGAGFDTPAARAALADTELLLAGWGCPRLDAATLAAAPRLSGVVMAGGAAAGLFDGPVPASVALSNAGDANGVPVAEYTLAEVLLALRGTRRAERLYRRERRELDREALFADAGSYRRTVGVVGASRIGRRVLELLRPFDLDVLVADPTLDGAGARALGARLTGLDELLAASDVVTLHAPVLPSTIGMLDTRRLALLPDGATLVNTARGALVDTAALTAELRTGRIEAVLDVTDPDEPLPPGHELWDLDGVVLTPHIAGSLGSDLRRLGEHLVAEAARFAAGLPFAVVEVRPAATAR